MRTAKLLKSYKSADPEVQAMLEAVAETAYAQGRRDASRELTEIATLTDDRVRRMMPREAARNSSH